MKDVVFLAHASEDKLAVCEIWVSLKAKGLNPWLDEKNLIGGENWRVTIPRVIRESKVFVACLSSRAVKKVGYIQTELRYALTTYACRPANSIFVIPLRLDDCAIPSIEFPDLGIRLGDLHWIDYWKQNGHARLLESLEKAGCIPDDPAGERPADARYVFCYGDYLIQLRNQDLTEDLRRQLVNITKSLSGLPSDWTGACLDEYLKTYNLQAIVDSITSGLPKIILDVLMLGIFFRSLQNSITRYPREEVERELQINIEQFLEQLRLVGASEELRVSLTRFFIGVEKRLSARETKSVIDSMDEITLGQLMPWLRTLNCSCAV